MLLANNLSFERDGKELFKELNISLNPNKIIQIKGRNGVGKTTLIKILAHMLAPKTGEIYWNGKNTKKNIYDFYKNITFIMDNHTSNTNLTVQENIKFWKKLFSSSINDKSLESVLELLSLNKYRNKKVGYLSAGEIKKIELCRLVIEQKKIWLLDEPYSDLDENVIEIINETFKNHLINGGMIIFTSHFNPELQNLETLNLENYANN